MISITGIPGLIEQAPVISRSRDGRSIKRVFKGLYEDCLAAIPLVDRSGYLYDVSMDGDGPLGSITVYAPDLDDGTTEEQQQIDTQWFFDANETQIPLWKSDLFPTIIDPDFRKALKAFMEVQSDENDAAALAISPTGTTMREFYDLVKAQVLDIAAVQFVIYFVAQMSPENTSRFMTNVGSVYDHDALIAAYPTIPAALQADIPATGKWLKRGPRKEQLATGRIQVRQEFWHAADWPNFLYPPAT